MSDYVENLIFLGVGIFFFLIAIVGYEVLFFLVTRTLPKDRIAAAIVKKVRKVTLFLFLEFATISSIGLLGLPTAIYFILQHLMLVVIIATIGIGLILAVRGAVGFLADKYNTESIEDISKRSALTQIHIMHHAAVIVIAILTFSAILITFPGIRALGIGLLSSAGLLGIILGMAAKPILLNLMVGFHIAFTKKIKIGDAVVVEGELTKVEYLYLTHAILKAWDGRRLFLPISYFVDKPFQNLSSHSPEVIANCQIMCDYSAPVEAIRAKFQEIVRGMELWNGALAKVEVIDSNAQGMELRFSMTTKNPFDAGTLANQVREKVVEFLQKEYPASLPRIRVKEES
jgi:small-conductance mechanosensitive channel